MKFTFSHSLCIKHININMNKNNGNYPIVYPPSPYLVTNRSVTKNTVLMPPSIPSIPVTQYPTNIITIPIQCDDGECPFPIIPFTIPLPTPSYLKNYPDHPIKPPQKEIPRSHLETPNNFYKESVPINSKYVKDYITMSDEDFNDVAFSNILDILLPHLDKNIFTQQMANEFKNNSKLSENYLKVLIKIVRCCGFVIDTNPNNIIHSKCYKPNQSIEEWTNIKNVLIQAKRSFVDIFGVGTNYETSLNNYITTIEADIKTLNGVFTEKNSNNNNSSNNDTKKKKHKHHHHRKNKMRIVEDSDDSDDDSSKYEIFKSRYKEYCKLVKKDEKKSYLVFNMNELLPIVNEKEKELFQKDESTLTNFKKLILQSMEEIGLYYDFNEGITGTMKNFQGTFKSNDANIFISLKKCIESVFDKEVGELLNETFLNEIVNRFTLSKEVESIINSK